MNKSSEQQNDRDIDVFRYVANEMATEEEQRFETELEHNQPLREQVANMVCTMATVDNALADSKVTPASKSRTKRLHVVRIAVAAAALVLLATLAITMTPGQPSSDAEADSIAIAWAESVSSEEFDLPEQIEDNEFASVDFESDDDWLVEVVYAANEDSANLN